MFSRRASTPRIVSLIVVGLVALVLGVWLGGHPSWIPGGLRSTFEDDSGTQFLHQALDVLAKDYYRPINRTDLINKGLAAAVASLNDPYSHYFDPSDYRSFQNNDTDPHFGGIGVDVLPNPRGLFVEGVFRGSPAAKAGLTHGDVIVAVGPVSLAKRTQEYASGLIKGPAGTDVTLTILRGRRRMTLTLTRRNIVTPVASGNIVRYRGSKLGYLQFTSFTDGSGDELRVQVRKVLAAGARALILDMRDNGGGLLNEAVNVASIFIPDGTIVSTRGRDQPSEVYVAKGNAIAPRIPLVVLVDRDTASAAEIVTGALQDRHRAMVVGTHTYGKGVFQEVQPLSNGGALDITVGEYFTPSGRNLGGAGVAQGHNVSEGAGIKPNVYALDNPHTRPDEALSVAERTVAAEIR
jgi:carboxyl-terminal processing protease